MVLAVDMVLTVTCHNEHVALFQGAVALGTPDECQVWSLCDSLYLIQFSFIKLQCPVDKATLDIAAALAIATSTAVTNLRQYINSDLGYNDLKF